MSTAHDHEPARLLERALASKDALYAWLRGHVGYVSDPDSLPVEDVRSLAGAIHMHAPEHPRAPRLLVKWDPDMREGSVHGNQLRTLQRQANRYRDSLRAQGHGAGAPHLFVLGCREFLLLFPLDGDPFARRLRFSPDRLRRPQSPLTEHFAALNARTMAAWADHDPGQADEPEREPESESEDAIFAEILAPASGELRFDFKQLLVGGKFDDEFVAFMNLQRQRIATLVLRPDNRQSLLEPMWRALRAWEGSAPNALGSSESERRLPSLSALVNQRRFRNGLIAAVDTVLLRLVLYRYLEAQFDYQIPEDESRQIALGSSYDQLLEQAARVDREALAKYTKGLRAPKRTNKRDDAGQLDLFGPPPVEIVDTAGFSEGVRRRAEYYQSSAGGDLHRGEVAEAADVLSEFLREHKPEELAFLLHNTSTDAYSFHYADLDARAFQQFYQETIGTDIRMSYDRTAGTARAEVVEHKRNRKEQGAFYTDERICAWLVEHTLHRSFDAWLGELRALLAKVGKGQSTARVPRVRAKLDELLGWRILDPTCGGGIFLRAAFEYLSNQRERILGVLHRSGLPDGAAREITADAPYDVFADDGGRPLSDQPEAKWEWHILLHMLYGVDIDVKAINVASNLLTLSALSYKPSGICFPSFINTNLKRGNALIHPLRPAERGTFLKSARSEIGKLLQVRQAMRDPNLERDEWRRLHEQAAGLTKQLVHGRIVMAYRDVFPDLDHEALIQRVLQVGVFLYEAEFPEVFFEISDKGKAVLRQQPGFDVILGNPPWEEPAAEYKHFLPEFDPGYRELSGNQAKQREDELLADEHIKARWDEFKMSVDDYKRLLTSGWYQHQEAKVLGKIPGAHTNLYKYATEMSWQMLRTGGRAGLVMDGGLWSDLSAKGLRQLLLDQSSDTAVCGFNNNRGIFPDVHRSYKFGCVSFRRGGATDMLRAVFMQDSLDAFASFEQNAASLSRDDIRSDPRDSYPVPEVRSHAHLNAIRAFAKHPSLRDAPWSVDTYSRELNAGEQRHFFHARQQPGYLPLVQGSQFNLFGVHQGALPDAWVDPSDEGAGGFLRGKQKGRILRAIADHLAAQGKKLTGGKASAALRWIALVTGQPQMDDVPDEWVRLDWDGYRLAWRDVARNDDRRTLIAAIVPPGVALSHKAPFVRPFIMDVHEDGIRWREQYPPEQLLYLAGALASFACDSVARSRLAKTTLSKDMFQGFPVPAWTESAKQRRVAELTCALTCLPATDDRPWADYRSLAAAVGMDPERHGLIDPDARRDAQVELDALMAELYGLDRDAFRFWMDELFMTPSYRDTHSLLRDQILARMP